MKYLLLMLAGIVMLAACESENKKSFNRADNPNLRQVEVQEVIQTSSYTYLKMKEEGDVYWGAIPRNDAMLEGETYYFDNYMEMENFPSKELDKTFDKIYFIQVISDQPFSANTIPNQSKQSEQMGKNTVGNMEIEPMDAIEGGITIAELFANKEKYEGKIVILRGHVVKYSEAIMNKNWAHIQDGTMSGGDFDLTITTLGEVEVGDIATFEGKVILNKDFGYGYAYDIILEDAELVEIEKATQLQ